MKKVLFNLKNVNDAIPEMTKLFINLTESGYLDRCICFSLDSQYGVWISEKKCQK